MDYSRIIEPFGQCQPAFVYYGDWSHAFRLDHFTAFLISPRKSINVSRNVVIFLGYNVGLVRAGNAIESLHMRRQW